jgi:glycosyltransferase involved in cell wall biosynthesis
MLSTNLPFVSVLLVTRNEEQYIEMSLMSVIYQSYPKRKYEIIIVDGLSNDRTLDIIKGIQSKYKTKDFNISVIKNEKYILSAGWNLGIKSAKGDYVTRIDAHSTAAPDFIEKSVETMFSIDAICVGGKLITNSIGDDINIISKVLSSPFGVGNSSFRVSDKAGYADTVVYGLYKKSVFEEVSFFDETTERNQDIELHSKIRKAGYKFYFNPEISSTYYTRNNLKKMLKQALGNGQWNMILIIKGTSAPSLRHLIPFAFVLFLIASVICGYFWHPLWYLSIGVICLHLVLGLYFARKKTSNFCEILMMPWIFMLLHLTYGLGYLRGLLCIKKTIKNNR